MKLKNRGKNILAVEVTQISQQGFWLIVNETEYFLPYREFPWFSNAIVSQIYNIRLLHGNHLHWPDLDVDLEIESLSDLEKYPLTYEKDLFRKAS